MYPEVKRTYSPEIYIVTGRRPPERKRVDQFSLNGEYMGTAEIKINVFIVENGEKNAYYLKTESNSLLENDIIEVNHIYGDYNIKRVGRNG